MRIDRTYIVILLSSIAVWLGFGLGVVPGLLEDAHSGHGVAFLNDVLAPHRAIPSEYILAQWVDIVYFGAIAGVVLAAFAVVLSRPAFARRLVGEATPGDIGAIRVLVCAVLLISTLWEDVASTAALPREQIRPMGFIGLLYLLPIGFDRFAASPVALELFDRITSVLLIFGMVGWKTKWTLPGAAVCYLIFGGLLRQYAWFYHTGLLALYMLAVLAILPAQHGFSLDRWVRLRKGRPVVPEMPSRRYGWMRYALWTTLALPYVMAGLSKIRNGGLYWWEASNFKFILFQSSLRPMEFDFDLSLALSSAPEAVFEVLAITALGGELLYGLVLFSRRARWLMPALMLLMHLGILFMQNILFFDLIILQAVFFNFRPLIRRLRDVFEPVTGRIHRLFDLTDLSAPRSVHPGELFGRRLTVIIAGLLTACWLFRIEFYPLTGMQMFSSKRGEPVRYEVLLARRASGEIDRAPVERSIRAMSDGRYRRILAMAFDPEREHITHAFLDSVRGRWNRRVSTPSDAIERFEIQQWEWYFLSEPDDPNYGRVIQRREYPVQRDNGAAPLAVE